jgi:uncharacterized protein
MAKYQPALKVADLVAIDMHVHASRSERQAQDPYNAMLDEGLAKYFKSRMPPSTPEVAQFYRERKMAAVIFTVDAESSFGGARLSN